MNKISQNLDDRCVLSGVFVGFDQSSPSYLVYTNNGHVRKARCVKFIREKPNVMLDEPVYDVKNSVLPVDSTLPTIVDSTLPASKPESPDLRKSDRIRTRPEYLNDYETDSMPEKLDSSAFVHYCYNTVSKIPCNYKEAISSNESVDWKRAMDEEIQALKDNETFEAVELPEGKSAIGGRWVFALKDGPNGQRFKARYVAKGYSQTQGIDYTETFSPTARMSSIRMLVQVAIQENMYVHQMDVKTAYLNAPIDCELFINAPEGYNDSGKNLILKLKKSLYGLKQSGRNWNHMIHDYLMSQSFKQSEVDNCVYVKSTVHGKVIIIIWVDDIILAASNENMLRDEKSSLCNQFKMKDLGEISYFLGIEFHRNGDSYCLSQEKYIDKLLERFNMSNCKPKGMPCEKGAFQNPQCR